MNRFSTRLVAALCVALVAAPAALATRVDVAPETYLEEAQAIVIGKMTNVNAEKGAGQIVVTEVIRGEKDLRQVSTRFGQRPEVDRTVTYDEGQEGIWLLRPRDRDENGTYYIGNFHVFYNLDGLDYLKKMMAALEELPWGEPVNGLAARSFVRVTVFYAQPRIYVAVKNVSDKPLRVRDYLGDRSPALTLVLPDGTERPIDVPKVLLDGPPGPKDYPVLAPGEVRYVGFWAGISTGNLTVKGTYRVKASYSNANKGTQLGSEDVWTGTVDAPEVTFEYAPAGAPGTPVP